MACPPSTCTASQASWHHVPPKYCLSDAKHTLLERRLLHRRKVVSFIAANRKRTCTKQYLDRSTCNTYAYQLAHVAHALSGIAEHRYQKNRGSPHLTIVS